MTNSPSQDLCARCGLMRREHHYNGAAYGVCGKFVDPTHDGAEGAGSWRKALQAALAFINTALVADENPTMSKRAVVKIIRDAIAPPKPAPDAVREKVARAIEDQYPGFDNIAKYVRSLGSEYFGEIAAPVPSPDGADKLCYVKRWRTLVSLPAKYADEILEALRISTSPAVAAEPDVGCIICANGNDVPEGDYCRACGREGLAFGLGAAVIKARGRQEPPTVPVRFATPPVKVDREAIAQIIDVEAFNDDRPTWHDRRSKALAKADAILSLPVQSAPDRNTLYAILSKHIPQDMIDGIWQEMVEAGQTGAGERGRISFPRWWIQKLRDGLFEMALPSGPLGDWAFLFREQLNDKLAKSARLTAARNESK